MTKYKNLIILIIYKMLKTLLLFLSTFSSLRPKDFLPRGAKLIDLHDVVYQTLMAIVMLLHKDLWCSFYGPSPCLHNLKKKKPQKKKRKHCRCKEKGTKRVKDSLRKLILKKKKNIMETILNKVDLFIYA